MNFARIRPEAPRRPGPPPADVGPRDEATALRARRMQEDEDIADVPGGRRNGDPGGDHGVDKGEDTIDEDERPALRPLFDERLDLGTLEGVVHGVEEVMESVRLRRIPASAAGHIARLLTVANGVHALRIRRDGPPKPGVTVNVGVLSAAGPFRQMPARGVAIRAGEPPKMLAPPTPLVEILSPEEARERALVRRDDDAGP